MILAFVCTLALLISNRAPSLPGFSLASIWEGSAAVGDGYYLNTPDSFPGRQMGIGNSITTTWGRSSPAAFLWHRLCFLNSVTDFDFANPMSACTVKSGTDVNHFQSYSAQKATRKQGQICRVAQEDECHTPLNLFSCYV